MSARRLALLLTPLSLLAATGAEPAGDTGLALRTAAALYDGIRTHTLANGLRVYLKPVPRAPVVTTMVAYKVGSADENLDHTGLSHYLEHLMFKGTEKLLPGDIDRITYRNGGQNNAYTTEDFTVFHFDFPPDHWQEALRVEADRMRNLRIDKRHEFEQEKGAVISELKRNEDRPWDLELKAILPLLFGKTAPYGHPVIGEREHVLGATAEVIKGHYDRWYHPNNAALVIAGAFDPDEALAQVERLFGPMPRAELPPRKSVPTELAPRPARVTMTSKFATPRLLMGWNTMRRDDPDYPVLNVVEALLATGKTSRLYRSLVEGAEVALSVDAGNDAGRYPGWFAIQVEVVPGKDIKRVEQMTLDELKKLADEAPPEMELRRVQRGILASGVFQRESVHGLADSIAQAVVVTDLQHLKDYLPQVLAVQPADVRRVVRKYLDPQRRVTLWSLPAATPKGSARGAPPPPRRSAPPRADSPGSAGGFSLQRTRRVELPNGLVLLLYEDHRLPLFVAEAEANDVRLLEPPEKAGVATLTGSLLDEGTSEHTGPQIAELIEGVGGKLTLEGSGGKVRVLAPDRRLGLDLLLECLMHPAFPAEAFARNKQQMLSEIEEAQMQPETRALQTYVGLVYGSHPLGRPRLGTARTVSPLTREDCAAFHRRAFVPNNLTLSVVGDFNPDEVIAEVTRRTADWKKTLLPAVKVPEVAYPDHFTQKIITMPRAAQLHFYMGHIGIRRDNPDYYKLLVLDYVLGTGPGFTDRLSSRLRDREGLAYTVTAGITSTAGRQPGVFTCYIGTDNDKFARVKDEFLQELRRIRDERPGDREVADAKNYLLGNLLLQFTTDDAIGAELLSVERYHLGFDYLEQFRRKVAAVTAQDVQEVARRYLRPDHMVLVAAGAVDAEGRALAK
jgi:zinc protease